MDQKAADDARDAADREARHELGEQVELHRVQQHQPGHDQRDHGAQPADDPLRERVPRKLRGDRPAIRDRDDHDRDQAFVHQPRHVLGGLVRIPEVVECQQERQEHDGDPGEEREFPRASAQQPEQREHHPHRAEPLATAVRDAGQEQRSQHRNREQEHRDPERADARHEDGRGHDGGSREQKQEQPAKAPRRHFVRRPSGNAFEVLDADAHAAHRDDFLAAHEQVLAHEQRERAVARVEDVALQRSHLVRRLDDLLRVVAPRRKDRATRFVRFALEQVRRLLRVCLRAVGDRVEFRQPRRQPVRIHEPFETLQQRLHRSEARPAPARGVRALVLVETFLSGLKARLQFRDVARALRGLRGRRVRPCLDHFPGIRFRLVLRP